MTFTGLLNELTLLDFGSGYDPRNMSGILTEPPRELRRRYRILAPRVDRDGNEIAGVPSATRLAPLGTYTGWNLRAEGFAEDELCGLEGTYVPFAETREERLAMGDPRRSLEERYGDHEGYVSAVRTAAERLVEQRLLLWEDAERAIAEAEASNVLKP